VRWRPGVSRDEDAHYRRLSAFQAILCMQEELARTEKRKGQLKGSLEILEHKGSLAEVHQPEPPGSNLAITW
jgi:hypothetical protein